ncbi:MAG TPA: hypothetical protein DCW29_21890 [Janthinobacterium sp.]|nr:hypothetical protein [Janthinobacterium sp.]
MPKTVPAASIGRAAAMALVDAARAAAAEIGIEATIAVVDAGGHLKAFERADAAPFLTADVAIDKAWTAVSFGLSTHVWNAILEDGKVSQLAHQPRLVAVGGGCPIIWEGRVVGGIGISGGNALQDQRAAEAALAALGFAMPA